MKVKLTRYPTDADWMEVKRRALVTIGKTPVNPPDLEWKQKILIARHSPIRWLMFSFDIECPSWVATHLARHVHAQPYIQSQREDRTGIPRSELRQDEPVQMIYDVNCEEMMVIAQKRLCNKAAPETRDLVREMCRQVEEICPEFKGLFVPPCRMLQRCPEMYPCADPPSCLTCAKVTGGECNRNTPHYLCSEFVHYSEVCEEEDDG